MGTALKEGKLMHKTKKKKGYSGVHLALTTERLSFYSFEPTTGAQTGVIGEILLKADDIEIATRLKDKEVFEIIHKSSMAGSKSEYKIKCQTESDRECWRAYICFIAKGGLPEDLNMRCLSPQDQQIIQLLQQGVLPQPLHSQQRISSSSSSPSNSGDGIVPGHPVKNPSWYFTSIDRDLGEQILTLGRQYGNLLVRPSNSQNNCYAIQFKGLEKRGDTTMFNFLIEQDANNRYFLKLNEGQFPGRVIELSRQGCSSLGKVVEFFMSVSQYISNTCPAPMKTNDLSILGIDTAPGGYPGGVGGRQPDYPRSDPTTPVSPFSPHPYSPPGIPGFPSPAGSAPAVPDTPRPSATTKGHTNTLPAPGHHPPPQHAFRRAQTSNSLDTGMRSWHSTTNIGPTNRSPFGSGNLPPPHQQQRQRVSLGQPPLQMHEHERTQMHQQSRPQQFNSHMMHRQQTAPEWRSSPPVVEPPPPPPPPQFGGKQPTEKWPTPPNTLGPNEVSGHNLHQHHYPMQPVSPKGLPPVPPSSAKPLPHPPPVPPASAKPPMHPPAPPSATLKPHAHNRPRSQPPPPGPALPPSAIGAPPPPPPPPMAQSAANPAPPPTGPPPPPPFGAPPPPPRGPTPSMPGPPHPMSPPKLPPHMHPSSPAMNGNLSRTSSFGSSLTSREGERPLGSGYGRTVSEEEQALSLLDRSIDCGADQSDARFAPPGRMTIQEELRMKLGRGFGKANMISSGPDGF